MKFGQLDIVFANQMFAITFDGPHGVRGLGAGNDLKAFVEGRIGSQMSSPELALELGKLKDIGDANDWNFATMCAPAKAAVR